MICNLLLQGKTINIGKEYQIRVGHKHYYFDRHGKWFVFIKPYKSCAMSKYNGGDALLVEKWSVVRDSVLNIGGIEYRVTRISNERIIIENKYFKDTLVYMPFPPPIERRASE
jgi:hypothetical protein